MTTIRIKYPCEDIQQIYYGEVMVSEFIVEEFNDFTAMDAIKNAVLGIARQAEWEVKVIRGV